MRSILLGFLLFCIWALVGRWYYVCQIKGHCGVTEYSKNISLERPATLALHTNDTLLYQGHQQFAFPHSSTEPLLNFNNQSFIEQLVTHLQNENSALLKVTGYYLDSEKGIKGTTQQNLGLARAEKVRQLLINRGISSERLLIDSKTDDGKELLIEPLTFQITEEVVATAVD